MVFLPRTGFISCSLLNVALSHDSCHVDKMYLLIKDLKSVHVSLKFEISRSSEAFLADDLFIEIRMEMTKT